VSSHHYNRTAQHLVTHSSSTMSHSVITSLQQNCPTTELRRKIVLTVVNRYSQNFVTDLPRNHMTSQCQKFFLLCFLVIIFTSTLRYPKWSLVYRLKFCWHFSSLGIITTRFAHVDKIKMITANCINVNRSVSFHLCMGHTRRICLQSLHFERILNRK